MCSSDLSPPDDHTTLFACCAAVACLAAHDTTLPTTAAIDVSNAMSLTASVRTCGYQVSHGGVSIALPSPAVETRDPPARTVSSSVGPTGAGNAAGHERQQLGKAAAGDDHDDGGGVARRSVRRYGVFPAEGQPGADSLTPELANAVPADGRAAVVDSIDPTTASCVRPDRAARPSLTC